MIDSVIAAEIAKLSDRELIDQLEDTWINQQMVPREDRAELLEAYYYLKNEFRKRQRTKERF